LKRQPFGIAYDELPQKYIWSTDPSLDRIYRLTPATAPNASSTTAWEWPLPGEKRGPSQIITDTAHACVWFTDYYSKQISRLNWTTNALDDWPVGIWGMQPWDLVMDNKGYIWFTAFNGSVFARLDPATNQLGVFAPPIGTAPPTIHEIATNGTNIYLTDYSLDNLYEFRAATFPGSGLHVFPQKAGGLSACLTCDPANNVWVTEPGLKLVAEQLAGSNPKTPLSVTEGGGTLSPVHTILNRQTLDIRIRKAGVKGATFSAEPEVIADPLYLFPVEAFAPWSIATGSEAFAWFTQPFGNQIGAVDPAAKKTWEYTLPTANALPLYITVVPSPAIEADHVWFTEPSVGQIGELLESAFVDVRVCPSLAPQYPPPSPGSIRWTWEPGAEIWIDAPSNGYNSLDHDTPEHGVVNHVYARVTNLGSTPATGVLAKFYYHNMSLGFSEWIPLPPTAPSPAHWTFIGSTTILLLDAGMTTDVYVDWTIGASVPLHQCIGVQVTYTGDVDLYDNVAYRNFIIARTSGSAGTPLSIPIWITNTLDRPGNVTVGLSGVPAGWQAYVRPSNFSLGAGQSRELTFYVQLPQGVQNGTQAVIELTGAINREVTGHVWVQILVLGTSRITCTATPSSVFPDDAVTISGAITPARAGVVVTVSFDLPGGGSYELYSWTDSSGKYSITTGLNSAVGTYQVTASWAGDGTVWGASASTTYDVMPPFLDPSVLYATGIGFAAGFGAMLLIALLIRRKPKTIPARQR
jgi:streptogramin lyase